MSRVHSLLVKAIIWQVIAEDMSYWRNVDRNSSGPGLRGADSLRNYGRAPPYEGDMRFDNRYGDGERMSEWETPYNSHISQMMPSYDVAENESWRPAREEYVQRLFTSFFFHDI